MVLISGLIIVCLNGCEESRAPTYFGEDEPDAAPAMLATAFDPNSTGSLTGRVTWSGELPRVPPFLAPISPLSEQPAGPKQEWPNPHAPSIDSSNRGVAGAVVFLRGVDAKRARPWDLPPLRVVVKESRYHIVQGDFDGETGFAQRGTTVTIESQDDRFQAVQARGAAFFTITLPRHSPSVDRVLPHSGVVELSSNAGQFWMRAHLFVADHPYLTRTDASGQFSLQKVPPGSYELACWLPNWHEAARELDAETTLVTRLTFRRSVVKLRDVTVSKGNALPANFSFESADFER
jgi:hypothetical protein